MSKVAPRSRVDLSQSTDLPPVGDLLTVITLQSFSADVDDFKLT
eukprot:UN25010